MSVAAFLSNLLNSSGLVPVSKLSVTGTPTGAKFLRDDASWQAIATGSTPTVLTYNSSGTWTKATDVPAGCTMAMIEIWAGGGGGGRASSINTAFGGGGGSYNRIVLPISSLGATETVTVGSGGLGATATGSGGNGGTSSFGSWVTTYGGGGGSHGAAAATTLLYPGVMTTSGSGGGTPFSGRWVGTSMYSDTIAVSYLPFPLDMFGGNGCSAFWNAPSVGIAAGSSIYGGGGGGSGISTSSSNGYTNTAGGVSVWGGNGGTAAATPTAGTQPAGGGAASTSANVNGAVGGAGRVKVTMW